MHIMIEWRSTMRDTTSKQLVHSAAAEKHYPVHIAAAYSALVLIVGILLGTLSYHPF
jgi:hypothetical protein